MYFCPMWCLTIYSVLMCRSLEHPVSIGMKELRAFFQRANIKLSNARLKELIQVYGIFYFHCKLHGEIWQLLNASLVHWNFMFLKLLALTGLISTPNWYQ